MRSPPAPLDAVALQRKKRFSLMVWSVTFGTLLSPYNRWHDGIFRRVRPLVVMDRFLPIFAYFWRRLRPAA